MISNKLYKKIIFLMAISTTLVACNMSDNQLKKTEKFVTSVQESKGLPLEPLPQFTNPQLPPSNMSPKRSPFSPAINNNYLHPDTAHIKGPLESYPLEQLHFVGVLSKSTQQWALISTPDGAIYNVCVGQYIGQNFGRVTQISGQAITIEETVSDGVGGWKMRTKSLSMTSYSQQGTGP